MDFFKNKLSYKIGLSISFLVFIMLALVIYSELSYKYKIIENEEKKDKIALINSFESKINDVVNLAYVAGIPLQNDININKLMAKNDRDGLYNYLKTPYEKLKENGILQLHFHTKDNFSFLRMHKVSKFGDDLSSFRKTVVDTNYSKQTVMGIELGAFGLGFRVVFPMIYNNEHIGSFELGSEFTEGFLKSFFDLYKGYYEFTLVDKKGVSQLKDNIITKYGDLYDVNIDNIYMDKAVNGQTQMFKDKSEKFNIILYPVKDIDNNIVGIIKAVLSREEALNTIIQARNNSIIIALILFIAITFIMNLLLKNIVISKIEKTSKFTENVISTNDLSKSLDIDSTDETGILANSFNTILDYMKNIVCTNINTSKELVKSVESLNKSSVDMNNVSEFQRKLILESKENFEVIQNETVVILDSVTQQNHTISSVTSAVEELSASIEEIKSNTKNAETLSKTASQEADKGGEYLDETMKSIREMADNSSQVMNIIELISNISEQTNLLALNAAIEAARAGEHGKGFAVVADEVRKLSDKSAEAASEINSLISASVESTNKADGIAVKTNEVFQRLSVNSKNLSELITVITESTNQQSLANTEIVHIMEDIMNSSSNIHNAVEVFSGKVNNLRENIENINIESEKNTEVSHIIEEISMTLTKETEKLLEISSKYKL
ncbi:MAG: methyl-accepting chemotaxis protein [Candidatus Muirbacterium halophilum]|nr:methyl-accepting chemotaxis protein [Candidatus Muirbacterium halophilum]MCK9474991.1 methyl-accepting chemotaxis protein [Candidatus Muirbacterium halophilum]